MNLKLALTGLLGISGFLASCGDNFKNCLHPRLSAVAW